MMEAVRREDQVVSIAGKSGDIAVFDAKSSRDSGALSHPLGLFDSIRAEIGSFGPAGASRPEHRETSTSGTAAEIQTELGRRADRGTDPLLPSQPVDERAFVVVIIDERMVQPRVPFS